MLEARALAKSYRAPSGASVPVLASVDLRVARGDYAEISRRVAAVLGWVRKARAKE